MQEKLASIAIPQLVGGGAEKLLLHLAILLDRDGLLSRIYSGSFPAVTPHSGVELVDLHSARALGALRKLPQALRGDPAQTFLLMLGYVNLAPLIRLLRPSSKIVLWVGNPMTPELTTLGGVSRLRYQAGLTMAFRAADQVIVQSDFMGRDLASHFPDISSKLITIYNFIEDALWRFQPPSQRPIAAPYLFTAATFKPQKAHDVLLAAYSGSKARAAGVRLVVAGVAPNDARYVSLMRNFGLSQADVLRLGFVNPYPWIAHAERCVLASHYEGFSNFLLEAAALGKRIIATNSPGGNSELFARYENVSAVPVNDPEALSAAMVPGRNDVERRKAREHLRLFQQGSVYQQFRAVLN